jgi:restriction system protein
MPIPDYQSIMLPLLQLAGDGQEHRSRDGVTALAQRFNLTQEQISKLLPSGQWIP